VRRNSLLADGPATAIAWVHTGSTGAADHQTELNPLLDILLATDLDLTVRYESTRSANGEATGERDRIPKTAIWGIREAVKDSRRTAPRADMVGYMERDGRD